MDLEEIEASNDWADEGHQQFNRPTKTTSLEKVSECNS
jgi:hypothetical protein